MVLPMPLQIPEAWHKHIHLVMILRGSWFSLHQNPREGIVVFQVETERQRTSRNLHLLKRINLKLAETSILRLTTIWRVTPEVLYITVHGNDDLCISALIRQNSWFTIHSLIWLTVIYIAHSLRAHIDARVRLTSQKNGFMPLLPLFSCILPFCW